MRRRARGLALCRFSLCCSKRRAKRDPSCRTRAALVMAPSLIAPPVVPSMSTPVVPRLGFTERFHGTEKARTIILQALGVGSHRMTALAASIHEGIRCLVTTFAALPALLPLTACTADGGNH
jgi:hypothetical protein